MADESMDIDTQEESMDQQEDSLLSNEPEDQDNEAGDEEVGEQGKDLHYFLGF